MSKPILSLENIYVDFERDGVISQVLDNVSLSVHKGEFLSIIGHSGCGKSTLLNVVAGLVPVTLGAALLDNKAITGPGPERAVVFQNHSLLPWMTVYENVRLAVAKLYGAKENLKQLHDRTMNNLELVKMTHARDKRPGEISGGMKQRVGIARALSMEPKVLLLDEPFGALDALTRADMHALLDTLLTDTGATTLLVTHDLEEALKLTDRVLLLADGRIVEDLRVPLPHPRRRADVEDLRAHLELLLH